MIVVTGGKGFIGGNLIKKLEKSYEEVICLDIVDDSLENINKWLVENAIKIDFIFHLGANTDTTEMNVEIFNKYNLESSKFIWNLCTTYGIPLVYASSAATYGDGEEGFDDEAPIDNLKPLNPYGQSKQDFDLWVQKQISTPPFWAGLKFFNVYGIGELKKEKMSSMILQLHAQMISNIGSKVKLFKSHKEGYGDGEQKRDFIYVDDIVKVCIFFMENYHHINVNSGIYNLGTGKARTFNDVVSILWRRGGNPNIEYIDIPIEIRDKYQYFTEAKMKKLRNIGYLDAFTDIEHGIPDYLKKLLYETR